MTQRARGVRSLRAAAVLLLVAPGAAGADLWSEGTFAAQLYEQRSPWGEPRLTRRRYTETLEVRAEDLTGDALRGGPRLTAGARLRLDSDLAVAAAERTPGSPGSFVPGAADSRLDVMTATLEGRRIGGVLGFALGRQLVVGPLGFWAFDGATVRVDAPAGLALEAFGGAEVRGGPPWLGTSRWEADGVRRDARRGFDPALRPDVLRSRRLAPAYGFALETDAVPHVDARLVYRHVTTRDRVGLGVPIDRGGPGAADAPRTSTERAGADVVLDHPVVGSLVGRFVWDLLVARSPVWEARIDRPVTSGLVLGAGVDHFLPTFDGDSIWNSFSHGGTTSALARGSLGLSRSVTLAPSGGARFFAGAGDAPAAVDRVLALDAALRRPTRRSHARISDQSGGRGHVRYLDASHTEFFSGGRYELTAGLSLADFADALRASRDARSASLLLGGAFLPAKAVRAGLEVEPVASELVGLRLRALATLEVRVR